MNVLVALIGWIIVAIGLLGIARPHLMPTAVRAGRPSFYFILQSALESCLAYSCFSPLRVVVYHASRAWLASSLSSQVLFLP